jgi:hypothetical protein
MQFSNIVIGVILLVFGRKLFWLVIGLAGFLFGMEMARIFFSAQPQGLQLAIGIGLGCLGALLAVLTQRLAFTVGGFFAGVFLALKVCQFLDLPEYGPIFLIGIATAGIIGAVVASMIMDEAITILACLVGAGVIVGELPLAPVPYFAVFLILTGAGFLLQQRLWAPQKENPN